VPLGGDDAVDVEVETLVLVELLTEYPLAVPVEGWTVLATLPFGYASVGCGRCEPSIVRLVVWLPEVPFRSWFIASPARAVPPIVPAARAIALTIMSRVSSETFMVSPFRLVGYWLLAVRNLREGGAGP
jgi:hypothetical protein